MWCDWNFCKLWVVGGLGQVWLFWFFECRVVCREKPNVPNALAQKFFPVRWAFFSVLWSCRCLCVCLSVWVVLPLPLIGSGRGISPLPSHRTVRESLPSHGSSCSLSLLHRRTRPANITMAAPISNAQIVRGILCTVVGAISLTHTCTNPFPISPI